MGADGWDMRLRWPFAVALAGVLLGATWYGVASAVVPVVVDAYQSYQDERTSAAEDARFEAVLEQALPAAEALATITLPDGVDECAPGLAVSVTGGLCWQGNASPVATARALAAKLRRIGATEVTPRCVRHPRVGEFCSVTAQLEGQEFNAFLGPKCFTITPACTVRGVSVSGGVGVFNTVPNLPRGTPIPLTSPR
ncbi:hypothetical protein [Pengzhenrongella sp.]|uniref:hypothetical protein n=1 Tax=Pengzhenrongella sp. TaxID=2888820 RepID=UPI002F93C61B